MNTYLVTTEHLENSLWFRDTEDFKVGMNAVAVVHASMKTVRILAFILMSNHVHFVLECQEKEAKAFIDALKKHYSRYLRNKYGLHEQLRRNGVDVRLLDGPESVEKAIAYVHMNSVAANICLNSTQYPWGTAQCIFSQIKPNGTPANSLKRRESFKRLHSKVSLPPSYLYGNDGYIIPESYVEVKRVENIFRTPKRMHYFLCSSSKSKIRMETNEAVPAFRDQLILSGIGDLCSSLFRKSTMSELNDKELTELMRQLKYRFACSIHQLARITGYSYEKVVQLLDSE